MPRERQEPDFHDAVEETLYRASTKADVWTAARALAADLRAERGEDPDDSKVTIAVHEAVLLSKGSRERAKAGSPQRGQGSD